MIMNTSKGIYAVMLLLAGTAAALPAADTSTGDQSLGTISTLIISGPDKRQWSSTGHQSLGTISTAVDVFAFTCPATTRSASAYVKDLMSVDNVAARMQVLLLKDSFTAHAEDSTSINGGENELPSYTATLFKDSGQYLMLVFKTVEGPKAYRASVVCNTFTLTCNGHGPKQPNSEACMNSPGSDPPTTIGMTQNQ